jgi:hypothetical protein
METGASATGSLSTRIPDVSQLTSLFGDLKGKTSGVKTPQIPLDRVQELAGKFNISIPDSSSWSSALPTDVKQFLTVLPDAASLAKPLAEPLQRVKDILNFPFADELKRIEDALTALTPVALGSPEALLNGLVQPLSEVAAYFEKSELLKLAGTLAGFFGAKDAEKLPGEVSSALNQLQTLLHDRVASAILAVVGLASASTSVSRTERLVDVIGGTFSWDLTNARFQAVLTAYGQGSTGLASALSNLDFAEAAQVDAVGARFDALNGAFNDFQSSLLRDLAFSEASIILLDTGALQDALKLTADALGKLDLAQLKALAASVQKAAEGLKSALKIDPDLSLDQFKKLLGDGLAQAATIMQKVDLSKVRDSIQSVLKVIQAPFKALEDLRQAVETTVRSAMAAVKQALAKIDFSPVLKTAEQFLDQLGDKISELDKLFTEVRGVIEDALKTAAAPLEELKSFLLDPQNGLKKKIEDVFHAVFGLLDGLNIKGAIDQVTGVLQPVNVELGKIEFAPVFDATGQAIDAVNTVLKTVAPLLVTDALKQKLSQATDFLRKLDFDQIASALNDAFDEILSSVDENALGAIKAEYQKVIDAIDKFDPGPALEEMQKEVFDPIIAELEKVKPSELLQPLQDGFNSAINGLRKFDPEQSLAFATKFFDDLLAQFQQLSPEKLLQPVEDALSDVKSKIEKVLMIDKALDVLNQVTAFLQPLVDAIEVGPLLDQLAQGFQELKSLLPSFDLTGIFSPVAGLLESAFARVGAVVDSTGIIDALQSVAKQGANIEDRLLALPAKLSTSAAELNKLDLESMLATLRTQHGELNAALQSHGGSSAVQGQFSLQIDALDPVPILTSMATGAARVRAAFSAKTAAFDQTVAGLKPSLQPFSNVREALASFLSAFDVVSQMIANPFRQLMGGGMGSASELINKFLDELDPGKWRPQFEPVLSALHDKVKGLLSDVVLNPIAEAASSLKSITGLLDISTLIQPVTEVFDDVVQTINQLNPAPIVKDLSDKYKQLLATLEKLNPKQFISEIQKLYTDDLIGVLKAVSPRDLLLPPLRELFDKIKSLLVSVDVEVLFKPILDRLKALKSQLVDGLEKTGTAYKQMLATLDSAGGAGASASASINGGA